MLLVLVVSLAAASCSGGGSDASAPTPPGGSPAATTGPDPTASAEPTGPDPTFGGRLEDEVEIGFPDRLLVGFDSLWVHTDDQFIHRIDPSTGETVASIAVGSGFCQGSGVGEGAVWSCADNALVRIDPATNDVDLETGLEMRSGQWSIGVGEGAVWIVDGETLDALIAVDPRSGDVIERIPLGTTCAETAVAAGAVWVSCAEDGVVLRIDPARLRVTGEVGGFEGTETLTISPASDGLWVGLPDPEAGLARIDGRSLDVETVAGTSGPGDTGAVWQEGDDVWIRSSDAFLTRVDARSLDVLERIEPPSPLGGGAVAVVDGSVWASSYDFNTIVRLAT